MGVFFWFVKCWGNDLTCSYVAHHSALPDWINSSCVGGICYGSVSLALLTLISSPPLQRNHSLVVAVNHCLPQQHPTVWWDGVCMEGVRWMNLISPHRHQPHGQSAVLFCKALTACRLSVALLISPGSVLFIHSLTGTCGGSFVWSWKFSFFNIWGAM